MNDGDYFRLRAMEAREAALQCEPGAVRQSHLQFAHQYRELAHLLDFSHNVASSPAAGLLRGNSERVHGQFAAEQIQAPNAIDPALHSSPSSSLP